jgi:uncharacterized protein
MELTQLANKQIQIGCGWVSHQRRTGMGRKRRLFANGFRYSTFNFLLPIDQSEVVEKFEKSRVFSLRSSDYLLKEDKSDLSLRDRCRLFLKKECGYEPQEIWLQTLPRIFGYAFNPVSFWYCYQDSRLDAILVEVNNTFGDRHFYFVRNDKSSSSLPKLMHVSPFFPMKGAYQFKFHVSVEKTEIFIDLYEDGELRLETCLALDKLKPLNNREAVKLLLRYGWLTGLIMFRIHYQALKIWLKGADFFRRPEPTKEKVTL